MNPIFFFFAFQAYKKWVSIHGEEPMLPGVNLTHDQLFFLNYAQIWCGSMRPEDALTKIRSSVHSPGPIRVLGPLSNSEDFARAYNCPPGSPMNPTKKCNVWWVLSYLRIPVILKFKYQEMLYIIKIYFNARDNLQSKYRTLKEFILMDKFIIELLL